MEQISNRDSSLQNKTKKNMETMIADNLNGEKYSTYSAKSFRSFICFYNLKIMKLIQ